MVLAIITFAYETILLFILASLGEQNTNNAFGWFAIISFIACSVISAILLIYNIYHIKNDLYKAKPIVGTVFSSISLTIGLIFVIIFFIILGILSSIGR